MDILGHDDILFTGNIEPAPGEIGTPFDDASFAPGPQERVDSCAIRSQQHILSMFGIERTETELVHDAIAHQEYSSADTSGTMLDDVGNLLERNGIDTHRYEGATLAHLISELAQGHKIIVGVDAYEIIADTPEKQIPEAQKDMFAQIPNHALVVVNVDPNTMDVDIVDPADGQLHRVPCDRFIDAWEDSNCFMVSTTKSPQEFQEGLGHQIVDETDHSSGREVTMSDQQPEMHGIDLNHDGIVDVFEHDLTGDGLVNQLAIDSNHDGIPDVIVRSDIGLVRGQPAPAMGGLGHISGLSEQDIGPSLGGLGHLHGIPKESVVPNLGGLGHVAGSPEQIAPGLGGLGHVSGMTEEGVMPNLGSLGHLSGGDTNFMPIDIDGDNIVDAVGIDLDGDNIIDALGIDINNDGIVDVIGVDLDGDGIVDQIIGPDVTP